MEEPLEHYKLVLSASRVGLCELRRVVVEVIEQLKVVYGCSRHRSIEVLFAVVGGCFFVEGQVHGSEVGLELGTVLLLLQDLLLGLLPDFGFLILKLLLRGSSFVFSIFVFLFFFVVEFLLLFSADWLRVAVVLKENKHFFVWLLQFPVFIPLNSAGQSVEKRAVVGAIR